MPFTVYIWCCSRGSSDKRHVAVRDRLPERAFGRAFRVDVDPLVVTGRIGKQVDVFLSNGHPVALPDRLAR